MEIDKIIDEQYVATPSEEDVKKITSVIENISGELLEDYEEVTNQLFVDSLVARYTTTEFFKKYPVNDNFFTIVDINIFNRTISVSVGSIAVAENVFKKTSGVLYK